MNEPAMWLMVLISSIVIDTSSYLFKPKTAASMAITSQMVTEAQCKSIKRVMDEELTSRGMLCLCVAPNGELLP